MSYKQRRTTIMTIGKTGDGKSAFGNLFLDKQSFLTSSNPDSCTSTTSSAENTVSDMQRIYIDTQGLDDTKGLDDANVKQMINFLRNWEPGVNAIGIVINGQCPRIDQGTKRLLKLIHVFFNNNDIWNSVFIVFTKWYKNLMTEEEKAERRKYAEEVRKIPNYCIGYNANPQIPCFFVDAKRDLSKIDYDTKQEITQINAFAYGLKPISTKGFEYPDVNYFKLIPEIRRNVLIKSSTNGSTRTRTYADQMRNKQISYNDVVSYSNWINTRTWTKVDRKIIREEVQLKIKIGENRTPIYRTEKYGSRRFGVCGPRKTRQVYDHTDVTTTYEDRKRTVIRDFDGNVSYGNWVQIRTFTEYSRA